MRKKALKLLVAITALTLVFSVGCKKKGVESGGVENIETTITLAQDKLDLKVGDSSYIVPTFDAQEGVNVVYRSTDESVVSVTEYGEVSALKEGTAEIIVTYGELQTKCSVTVSLGGELPQIVVNGIDENSVQMIAVGDSLSVNPYVSFNSKNYDDATVEYTIADTDVVEFANGSFIAKKIGETSVTIRATWRGVNNATLERKFTVKVIENVELSVNGGLNSVFNLYTVGQLGNLTYDAELPFVITANQLINGSVVALTPTVNVVEGEELITIENGKIRSNGIAGVAEVEISCMSSGNEKFEATVTVNVLRSVGVYAEKVLFSAADGELPISDIFGQDELLTSAECEGESLIISEDKKCVLGLTTLSTGATEKTITVYGQNVGYQISLEAYTKVIDEAKDLEYFILNNENTDTITARFNGYYILAKDIDASGYVRGTSGFVSASNTVSSYSAVGLTGTFDGRGHVISNLTLGEVGSDFEKFDANKRKDYTYSLFGVIGGGTVKNLALDGINFAAPASVTKGSQAALATSIRGGTIENVYVRVTGLNYSDVKWRPSVGLAHHIDETSVLKNCIVEVEDDGTVQAVKDKSGDQLGASYGSLVGRGLPEESVLEKNWKNVYVISTDALSVSYKSVSGVYVPTVTDAANANPNADNTVNTIKRYQNISEFLYADNDYSAFDTRFWTVNEGFAPVWKGLEGSRYARVTVNGEPMKELTLNAAQASGEYVIGVEVLGEATTGYTMTAVGSGLVITRNTFRVAHAGVTEFKILFEGTELTLTVNVTTQTTTYAQTVEFSAMHGKLPLADIFGTDNVELVSAFQGETALTISQDKKCVLGVQTLGADGKIAKDRAVQTQITVYTASQGVVINLNAYAGIITSAEDLAVFCLDNTNYAYIDSASANDALPQKLVNGYYVLGNDIDASKTTWTMPTQGFISSTYNPLMDSKGFQGTFDGCGYTISNLTFGGILTSRNDYTGTKWKNNSYSLFGIIGKNAVVKNFALTNVQYKARFNGSAETMATCSGLAYYISSGATVENVYVSVKGVIDGGNATNATFAAFAYAVSAAAKLNNIVVDNGNVNETTLGYKKYGSFVGRKHSNDNNTLISTDNWKNIYVITKDKPLYTGSTTSNSVLYAANEGQTGVDVVAGLYKYATASDWADATHDYSSFTNEYWSLTTGVPTFKAKN